ncbi:hypothetical protein [Haliscomenobacter sp.]|uniref:hypothetical protein n=1 Tax=Haliscomenobacter sp. TaxID=2717303 RepID=UPI003593BA89
MRKLNVNEIAILEGGSKFLDGFCVTVAAVDAGIGLAVLAGATVATGGAAAWVWGGINVGCAVYGGIQLFK